MAFLRGLCDRRDYDGDLTVETVDLLEEEVVGNIGGGSESVPLVQMSAGVVGGRRRKSPFLTAYFRVGEFWTGWPFLYTLVWRECRSSLWSE